MLRLLIPKGLLKKGVMYTYLYVVIVDDVRSMLTRDWNIVLVHILHERNFCVDWLTKFKVALDNEIKLF